MPLNRLRQTLTFGSLVLLAVAACKPAAPVESVVKTDETRASVLPLCEQVEPEGQAGELAQEVCGCVKDLPGMDQWEAAACEGLGPRLTRLKGIMTAEAELILRDSQGTQPSEEDRRCANGLVDFYEEVYLETALRTCRDESRDRQAALRNLLTFPEKADDAACWRLIRMDGAGCLVASPCVGSGPSAVDALGAAAGDYQGPSRLPEGQEVALCHPAIRRMHALKDPRRENVAYNYPFANLIGFGRSSKHITYGAANCHGTAQEVVGGFLKAYSVDKLSYHSPTVKEECADRAEAAFREARERSTAAGHAGPPRGEFLPVERGGYVVNMDHDPSCPADACGRAEFFTHACEDGLESYVFIDDLCVNCWGKMLENNGHTPLPADSTWRDLKPGCVMTQSDHSITVTLVNDGMCYYYESAAPFAVPQLRVQDCPSLHNSFRRRWCPAEPLRFTLQAPRDSD